MYITKWYVLGFVDRYYRVRNLKMRRLLEDTNRCLYIFKTGRMAVLQIRKIALP